MIKLKAHVMSAVFFSFNTDESVIVSYLNLGRTYMFPETHHLSYIKIIYSIIIINNDHINILYYIMPYRVHS